MLPQHRHAAQRIAAKWWWLLPRDDLLRRLDEVADEIRSDPKVNQDLLDLAVESIKTELNNLDKGAGHA
jgi:hypothetical protein